MYYFQGYRKLLFDVLVYIMVLWWMIVIVKMFIWFLWKEEFVMILIVYRGNYQYILVFFYSLFIIIFIF